MVVDTLACAIHIITAHATDGDFRCPGRHWLA